MKLLSDSFEDDAPIPGKYAFAVKDERAHVRMSENRNPHFAWADLPRVQFCHWALVDLKPDAAPITEG